MVPSIRLAIFVTSATALTIAGCGGKTDGDVDDDAAFTDDGDSSIGGSADSTDAGDGGKTAGGGTVGGDGGGTQSIGVGGVNGDGDGDGMEPTTGGLSGDGDGDLGTGGQDPSPVCELVSERPGVAAQFDRSSAAQARSDNSQFFDFPWPEIDRPLSDFGNLPNPQEATGCTPEGSEFALLLTNAIDPFEYRRYLYELASRSVTEPARHPVIYVRFDGSLGERNLPTAAGSLGPDSPIFLINIDEGSSKRGSLIPIESRIFNGSLYVPDNTLAVMPAVGFPLEPSTLYAMVVLADLEDLGGAPLGASATFLSMIAGPECDSSNPSYFDTVEFLNEVRGISTADLAALTIFESGAPTTAVNEVIDDIDGLKVAPEWAAVELNAGGPQAGGDSFVIQEGTFNALIQQKGAPPYLPELSLNLLSQSVDITLDANNENGSFIAGGIATSAGANNQTESRLERLPFVLTLPIGPGETSNNDLSLPLVIYGPGTGGSRYTPLNDGVAEVLAQAGYAVLTVDPVMHAQRSHSENIDAALMIQLNAADNLLGSDYAGQLTDLVESGDLFFNPFQLEAARGNTMQGAVDYAWQAKVFSGVELTMELNGSIRRVSFHHLSFFGHSQGGSIGPLLASSESFSQSLLSGASGHIPSILLGKTKPSDTVSMAPMLKYIICDQQSDTVDAFHPVMATIGHFFEPADGEHYMGELTRPGTGLSLFLVQGIDDHYSPPLGNEALSTAGLLHEIASPSTATAPTIQGQQLLDLLYPTEGYAEPWGLAQGNVEGQTTGFSRYSGVACSDAHFVFACNSDAVNDWYDYFSSALDGIPVIH